MMTYRNKIVFIQRRLRDFLRTKKKFLKTLGHFWDDHVNYVFEKQVQIKNCDNDTLNGRKMRKEYF